MPKPIPTLLAPILAARSVAERQHLTGLLARARSRIDQPVRRADAKLPFELILEASGPLQLFEVVQVVADDVGASARGDAPARLPLARARELDPGCEPGDELLILADLPREAAAAAWLELRREPTMSQAERAGIEAVLAALAASSGDEPQPPAGSIGAALCDNLFAGLQLARAAASLEVRASTLVGFRREDCEEQRWWYALDLRVRLDEVTYDVLLRRDEPAGALVLGEACHPDASERLERALGDWLEALTPGALASLYGSVTLSALLGALVPTFVEGSLPHWIETTLLGVLQPGGAWITRACGPDRIVELVCTELRVERTFESFALVVAVLRVIVRTPDEAISDIREREVWLGKLDVGRGSQRLDDDAVARAEAAVACWRGAAEHRLAHVVEEFETHDAYDCMPGLGLAAMLQLWIDEGPPAPRPCPLHLDDEVFARAARSLRELDDAEMEPLRARLGHHAGLAYRIGPWTIVLGPYLVRPDQHVFWEDQILVMHDEEAPSVILMSDPWDKPTCSVVDGDPHAYRGFATWLGEALRRSGQDRVLRSLRGDDDDDDDEPTPAYDEFPVSAWLTFGDRWREEVEHDALVDWRLQRDIVIPGALFWRSGIYGHTAERRAELARGVDTWHRFLREVIDPSFVGRRPEAG